MDNPAGNTRWTKQNSIFSYYAPYRNKLQKFRTMKFNSYSIYFSLFLHINIISCSIIQYSFEMQSKIRIYMMQAMCHFLYAIVCCKITSIICLLLESMFEAVGIFRAIGRHRLTLIRLGNIQLHYSCT